MRKGDENGSARTGTKTDGARFIGIASAGFDSDANRIANGAFTLERVRGEAK